MKRTTNLTYYMLALMFLSAAHAQLIRSYFEKRALFYKPMENNKVLNITPLYSYTSISTISSCVRSCVNIKPCFAVNYGFKDLICELLDQDRSTKLSSDFVERTDYVYMDTLTHFDGCYIGESCYPCYCQANSYTREPCDCTSSTDVPTPNVHIPFKRLQKDTGTSPYGRGDDNHGGTDATIVPSTGRISKDQFGKESALHLINNYLNPLESPLDFGSFIDTPISPSSSGEKVGSVSFWFRTTVNAFHTSGCKLIMARNQGSIMAVSLQANSDPTLYTYFVWYRPFFWMELGIWHITTSYEELMHWTHIAITFRYEESVPATVLKFYINGVLKALDSSVYTWSSTDSETLHLQSDCHGTYMNDLAIWYSALTDDNVWTLYGNDVSNPKWDLSKNIVTAGSCKALQDENPSLQTNGYYWILLDGHMTAVWCDMEIDGGGWTRISYMDVDVVGSNSARWQLEVDNHLLIGEAHKRNIFLSTEPIRTLEALMGYRQIRVFCQAPEFHNRIIDIATTGPAIVDKWLERTSTEPSDYCSVFYRLEDDTSIIFSSCSHDEVTLPVINKFANVLFNKELRIGYNKLWYCDEASEREGGEYMIFVR